MKKLLFGILGLLVTISGWSAETDSGPISSVTVAGLVAQNGTTTPNTPIDIVSNNGVLKVSRNLFDYNAYGQNTTVSLAATQGDDKIWYTGSSSSSVAIPVMPNKTYTISIGHTSSSSMFRAAVTERLLTSADNDSNPYTPVQVIRTTTPNTPITISTGSNGHYLYVQVSSITFGADVPYLMIELGSTATEYMPYGQIYTDGEVETIADSANHTATVATLLGVGDYRDTQNINTGAITRNVGVKVLDGTENWENLTGYINIAKTDLGTDSTVLPINSTNIICSHFETKTNMGTSVDCIAVGNSYVNFKYDSLFTTVAQFKQYLADQYAAGTPVIIVYPLATATTESVAGQTMTTAPVNNRTGGVTGMTITTLLSSGASVVTTIATNAIKIATTAYNTARFSPVVTELNDTIATIRSVVTNTINQTKAIADLQATKQTRPDETCPAGKKCLLVEDNDGTPHWFEIVESPEVQ